MHKENVAIWTSKNGFSTFYSNRVLMSTGVNFMFLRMKIEIWKRLEVFLKLRNRSDAQSASKFQKVGFFTKSSFFAFGKPNLLVFGQASADWLARGLFGVGCHFFEGFSEALKLLRWRYDHPWKHIRARKQLGKPISAYSSRSITYGQIP